MERQIGIQHVALMARFCTTFLRMVVVVVGVGLFGDHDVSHIHGFVVCRDMLSVKNVFPTSLHSYGSGIFWG